MNASPQAIAFELTSSQRKIMRMVESDLGYADADVFATLEAADLVSVIQYEEPVWRDTNGVVIQYDDDPSDASDYIFTPWGNTVRAFVLSSSK